MVNKLSETNLSLSTFLGTVFERSFLCLSRHSQTQTQNWPEQASPEINKPFSELFGLKEALSFLHFQHILEDLVLFVRFQCTVDLWACLQIKTTSCLSNGLWRGAKPALRGRRGARRVYCDVETIIRYPDCVTSFQRVSSTTDSFQRHLSTCSKYRAHHLQVTREFLKPLDPYRGCRWEREGKKYGFCLGAST